jgi:hypothetical protein
MEIRADDPNAYQISVMLQDREEQRGGLNLDHSLSIWRGLKVFLVEWNADTPDKLHIAAFRRTDLWEVSLFALGRTDPLR